MSERRAQRDTILGLVFFGGLGLLLWSTLNLTDLTFGVRPSWTIYFENVAQLQRGDTVMLLGSRIGRVEEVIYAPKGDATPESPFHRKDMRVTVTLDREVPVNEGSVWAIRDSSLLGGKLLELTPSRDGAPVDEGSPMVGVQEDGPLEAVRNTFAGENGENISGLLRGANTFFETLNSREGTIGALVNSRELYEKLVATVDSLQTSVRAIEQQQGALGRIIGDREMAEDLAQLMSNLREISDKINEERTDSGLVSRLINDEQLAIDVVEGIRDLRSMIADVRDGKGPLGALLRDKVMAADLKSTVANARKITELAGDKNAGIIGALLADADLSQRFRTTLQNVEEFSNALVNGDGLLNRLVNDPELSEQFSRIIRQVSRAIEDAREAAPIGTFITVLGAGL